MDSLCPICFENFEEDEPQQKQSAYSNQIDSVDKSMLSQRFFELNPTNYEKL